MECPRISLKNTVIDVTKKTSVRHSSTHQIEEVYLGTSIPRRIDHRWAETPVAHPTHPNTPCCITSS